MFAVCMQIPIGSLFVNCNTHDKTSYGERKHLKDSSNATIVNVEASEYEKMREQQKESHSALCWLSICALYHTTTLACVYVFGAFACLVDTYSNSHEYKF